MSVPRDPRRAVADTLAQILLRRPGTAVLDCGSGIFEGLPRARTRGVLSVSGSPALMLAIAAGICAAGRDAVCIAPEGALTRATVEVFPGVAAGMPSIRLVGVEGSLEEQPGVLGALAAIPGLAVICPADAAQALSALAVMMNWDGPAYLCLPECPLEDVIQPGTAFKIGPPEPLRDGGDICLIASGALAGPALRAADRLLGQGVFAGVVHMPTLLPLDGDALVRLIRRTGRALCCEGAGPTGGLGDAVRRALRGQPARVDAVRCGSGEGTHTAADAIFLQALEMIGW